MIDLSKKYTWNGYEVVGLYRYQENAVDNRIIAHISFPTTGRVGTMYFREDGKDPYDPDSEGLVEVKEKVKRWFNVYKQVETGEVLLSDCRGFKSHREAYDNSSAFKGFISTVSIEVEV